MNSAVLKTPMVSQGTQGICVPFWQTSLLCRQRMRCIHNLTRWWTNASQTAGLNDFGLSVYFWDSALICHHAVQLPYGVVAGQPDCDLVEIVGNSLNHDPTWPFSRTYLLFIIIPFHLVSWQSNANVLQLKILSSLMRFPFLTLFIHINKTTNGLPRHVFPATEVITITLLILWARNRTSWCRAAGRHSHRSRWLRCLRGIDF